MSAKRFDIDCCLNAFQLFASAPDIAEEEEGRRRLLDSHYAADLFRRSWIYSRDNDFHRKRSRADGYQGF